MTDQERESNANESTDSDDSLSLLQNLSSFLRSEPDEDAEDSQFGNREQEKEAAMETKPLEPSKSAPSSGARSAAGRADSTSRSAKVETKKKKLNKRDGRGETYLHKACRKNDVARVKALIRAGVHVDAKDNAGWTALHEAAAFGNMVVVEQLLKAGANVHARSSDGVTALHDAVSSGNHQVVKLLVQYGSNIADKNKAGLSAMDMARNDDIRALLLSRPGASGAPEQPQHTPQGGPSADVQWLSRNDPVRPRSRCSAAGRPGDVKPGRNNPAADNRPSKDLSAVLEDLRRKQAEISVRPLISQEDAGRCHAALVEINQVLFEAQNKQQRDKDDVARRCRSMPAHFRQPLLRSRLVALAARQETILEILRKQTGLFEEYATAKAELSAQTPDRKARLQPSPSPSPSASKRVKSSRTPVGANTLQHFNFQMKGNALIQTQDDDDDKGAHLSQLIQSGVMSAGSALQLLLKGKRHQALVQADGSLKDARGKRHRAPERWLESILGKNIPVSSTYAWDKVTFGDKPLSHYLLSAADEDQDDEDQDALRTEPAVDVRPGADRCLPDLSPGLLSQVCCPRGHHEASEGNQDPASGGR
ncbi:ankyrin repeat domain-containing protein 31-like isoform X2 [Clinocottus analis]|uniref:ankyrin repeat domain-containing protein 31-like isoform X2 n=1 Tax=Clinocottus analis TaxID=304258 RepID=UPI0035C1AE12